MPGPAARRTRLRLRPVLVALLLLAGLLAAGCGTGGDDPASGFEGDLRALAGVADARVERVAFDTEYWGEEIVVDMDGAATGAQVATVLDAFLARRRETGGDPQSARVTIGAGTTRTEGDPFAPDAPPHAVPADRPAGNARGRMPRPTRSPPTDRPGTPGSRACWSPRSPPSRSTSSASRTPAGRWSAPRAAPACGAGSTG